MCRHPGQKARRAPKGQAGQGQEGLCGRTGVVGCDRAVTSNNTRPSTQPLLAWPRSHISTLTKYAVHDSLEETEVGARRSSQNLVWSEMIKAS